MSNSQSIVTTIELDPETDDLFIVIPDELTNTLNWLEGDLVNFEYCQHTRTWIITKKV